MKDALLTIYLDFAIAFDNELQQRQMKKEVGYGIDFKNLIDT
jgi:hypothetical protein